MYHKMIYLVVVFDINDIKFIKLDTKLRKYGCNNMAKWEMVMNDKQ